MFGAMDFYFTTRADVTVQIMISLTKISMALVAFLWARHFRILRFN